MGKRELQLKEVEIKEKEKTKRTEITKKAEDWVWSKRIILGIIITTGVVISIGFITGFGR